MHLAGSVPWSMSFDTPEVLEFAAFIGKSENFNPYPDSTPKSQVEAQWREWWLTVPQQYINTKDSYVQAVKNKEQTGRFDQELLQRGHPKNFHWDPPEFSSLSDTPELKKLCLKYWPQYHKPTYPEFIEFVQKQERQINRLETNKAIQEIEQQKGRQITFFRLNVQWVSWPTDYKLELSENLLILGTDYAEPSRLEELKTILRKMIERIA